MGEIDGVFTGTVAKYVFMQGWGFIEPDDISALPADAQEAIEKAKDEAKVKAAEKGKEESDKSLVYFRKPDVDPDLFPLDVDEALTFEIYTDEKGVGAFNIKAVEGAPKKERPERTEGKAAGKGRDGKSDRGKGKDDRGKGKDKGKGKDDRGKGGRGGEDYHHVIELEETDPDFAIRQKIVGEGGTNVKHVQEACNAKVQVSKRQPLRVDISCESERKLNQAVKMMEDLISCVWEEYEATQNQDKRGKSKGGGKSKGKDKGGKDKGGKDKGGRDRDRSPRNDRNSSKGGGKSNDKGGGKGKSDSQFSKTLKLRKCDPAFRLRGVLVGEGGQNVKHIQEQCHVKLQVREDDGEMRVEISAESQDDLRKADAMAKDLINMAYSKYDDWKSERGGDSRDTRGDSKGSKGKGKRREQRDDDGPSQKRRRV